MACVLSEGRLTLSGDVGGYFWGDDAFSYSDVFTALATHDDNEPLTVVINSGGGIATEGAAIHAMLARRKGRTDVLVDGIAASAASLIAMAGETVSMSPGSTMMIHDPATFTFGDSAAHAKSIEGLDALAKGYAAIYAAKSGKSADDCRTFMRNETWLTADDAVAQGFADRVEGTEAPVVAAFPYQIYAHAPQPLVAMAKAHHWQMPDRITPQASASASTSPNPEIKMAEKTTADAVAAENADLKRQIAELQKANAKAEDDSLRTELEALKSEKADRERADAIMALDEATGRADLAKALAAGGMTVEAAKVALAAAPNAEAPETPIFGRGLGVGSATASAAKKGDVSILAAAVASTNNRR